MTVSAGFSDEQRAIYAKVDRMTGSIFECEQTYSGQIRDKNDTQTGQLVSVANNEKTAKKPAKTMSLRARARRCRLLQTFADLGSTSCRLRTMEGGRFGG